MAVKLGLPHQGKTDRVSEQGVENICTYEGWNSRKLEKCS
jgi:hypothetical protein